MSKDLTQGRPFRVLLQFSLPVIAGNLFQLFYTLADTVIVGRTLGAQALAAVGSTTIVIYFVLCFVQGFTGGFGICLAQRFGARDENGQRSSAAVSWLLSAGFAAIITVLFCALAHPILRWMRTPEDIYAEAYSYMFIVLLGTGATVFYNMISNMLRSLGRQPHSAVLPDILGTAQCCARPRVYPAARHGRRGLRRGRPF